MVVVDCGVPAKRNREVRYHERWMTDDASGNQSLQFLPTLYLHRIGRNYVRRVIHKLCVCEGNKP